MKLGPLYLTIEPDSDQSVYEQFVSHVILGGVANQLCSLALTVRELRSPQNDGFRTFRVLRQNESGSELVMFDTNKNLKQSKTTQLPPESIISIRFGPFEAIVGVKHGQL